MKPNLKKEITTHSTVAKDKMFNFAMLKGRIKCQVVTNNTKYRIWKITRILIQLKYFRVTSFVYCLKYYFIV